MAASSGQAEQEQVEQEQMLYWCLRPCVLRRNVVSDGYVSHSDAEVYVGACRQRMLVELPWLPPLPSTQTIKAESPGLLAICIAMGSQIRKADGLYSMCLDEASFYFPDALSPQMFDKYLTQRHSALEVYGAVVYYAFIGQPRCSLAAIASLVEHLELEESLEVLASGELQVSSGTREALLNVARILVSSWQYTVVLSVVNGTPCPMLLGQHGLAAEAVDVFQARGAEMTDWDRQAVWSIRWCCIVEEAAGALSLTNMDRNPNDDGYLAIERYLQQLQSWYHDAHAASPPLGFDLELLDLGVVLVCSFHDQADLAPGGHPGRPSRLRMVACCIEHGARLLDRLFAYLADDAFLWRDAVLIAEVASRRVMECLRILPARLDFSPVVDRGWSCLSNGLDRLETCPDRHHLTILRQALGSWIPDHYRGH